VNKRIFFKSLFFISVVCVAHLSHAHRFYASFTQIDMQSEKGVIEITHRIFTHDIEDLLRRYEGGNQELEVAIVEKFLQDYVMQAFAIYDEEGEKIPLTWIAIEITLNDIFVYQEAPMKTGQKSLQIADRILMDIFEDQSNTVNLKLDGRVKSHTFHIDSEVHKITF
jgi:hypothetical protein